MLVSDIIIDYLASKGVEHVFLMTGGHVAFLLDRFHGRTDIDYICVAHEQSASMAADAVSRLRPGSMGVAIATSGPGATNLLTGIGCSWFDSIPCLCITGQVNTYEAKGDLKVRQTGFQEMEIVRMAKPITKWAAELTRAEDTLYFLDKAWHIATSGRPGPVLLDVPMDIQRVDVDPAGLRRYHPPRPKKKAVPDWLDACLKLIRAAKRPAILAGGGVRNANASAELRQLSERLGAPVCLSMNGIDAFPHDHPNYAGFIGVYGNRGGNLTLANCDLLIAVGSRLDSRQTGVKTELFARHAKKVVVDIDPAELNARVKADLAVQGDAGDFLRTLCAALEGQKLPDRSDWLAHAASWRQRYSPAPARACTPGGLDPYAFMDALSRALGPDDVVVLDTGQNMVWGVQAIHPRANMRMFTAGGMSPMGYSFPAAMGAAFSGRPGRAVAIIGDGGMQINVQELETVRRHNLPLTVFVVNNSGLGLIRQFQDDYLGSRHTAARHYTGYTTPDFVRVAQAYDVTALRIDGPEGLDAKVREALSADGPVLCDVCVDPACNVIPKALMGHPIEDQFPYIPREELLSQMIVEPVAPESYRIEDDPKNGR